MKAAAVALLTQLSPPITLRLISRSIPARRAPSNTAKPNTNNTNPIQLYAAAVSDVVPFASKLDEATTCSDGKCLGTVMRSQLLHDVPEVNLHSLLGYEEPFGDVAISVSTGQMLEHLGLPFAQIVLTKMLSETSCYCCGNVL